MLNGEITGFTGPYRGNYYVGAGLVSCIKDVIEVIKKKITQTDMMGRRISGPARLELPGLAYQMG